jgi:hypothetical protein
VRCGMGEVGKGVRCERLDQLCPAPQKALGRRFGVRVCGGSTARAGRAKVRGGQGELPPASSSSAESEWIGEQSGAQGPLATARLASSCV